MTHSPRPPSTEDEQLVRRFVSGEEQACRMVERWAWSVVRLARFRVPPDEREDVVQQTLLSAWKACTRQGFVLRTELRAFLWKVAMARCIDLHRRRRAAAELGRVLAETGPAPARAGGERVPSDRLLAAVSGLGPGCREIIRLHLFQDLPYREISRRTGRSEVALRVQLFGCIRRLRELLGRGEPRSEGSR